MELCPRHKQRILDEVKAQGMESLMHDEAEAGLRRLLSEEDAGFYPDTFDPVLSVEYAIGVMTNIRMRDYGGGIQKVDSGCPICGLDVPHWIPQATSGARKYVDEYLLLER